MSKQEQQMENFKSCIHSDYSIFSARNPDWHTPLTSLHANPTEGKKSVLGLQNTGDSKFVAVAYIPIEYIEHYLLTSPLSSRKIKSDTNEICITLFRRISLFYILPVDFAIEPPQRGDEMDSLNSRLQ